MPISLASSSSKSFNDYVYGRLPYRQLKSKMITKPMCGTRIQSYQFVYFVARIHDKKKENKQQLKLQRIENVSHNNCRAFRAVVFIYEA